MKQQRFNEQFASIYDLAVSLSKQVDADVLLVMLDGPTDWQQLSERAGPEKILAAADTAEALEGAKEAGKLRQEGKEYVIQDGDVLLFKFNV